MLAILPALTLLTSLCAVSNGELVSKRQEPTLYLFGDSTMSTCRFGPVYATQTAGWGTPLASLLSLPVVNDAKSGYSARQAYREKIYDKALASAKAGDYAVIQWGRNDVGSPQEATLQKKSCDPVGNNFATVCKGTSAEPEVYTFVKYMVTAAKAFQAKGVHVIIASMTTKSTFQDATGTFKAEESIFIDWAKVAAQLSGASYIDHHASMTNWYKRLGAAEVKTCYLSPSVLGKQDFTHTTPRGAEVAARSFIAALTQSSIPLKSFIRSTPGQIAATPKC